MRRAWLVVVLALADCQRAEDAAAPTSAPAPAPTTSAAAPSEPAPAEGPDAGLPASLFDLETPLEDQAGRHFTLRELHADRTLVAMFYARCTYACPTLIADLQRIDLALSPAAKARTRVVLVSFTPDLDDPKALADLAYVHGLDPARWVLARASNDDTTRDLANALGLKYTRLADGNVNHTSAVTLLDAAGVARARLVGLHQDARDFIAHVERGH